MEALCNAGAVRQLGRYARETGLPLETLLDDVLKSALVASTTAERVPAHAIVDMLQLCAIHAKRSDFGASAAAWARVRGGYGPLSLSWEYAPTLGEAIRVNQRFIHADNAAVSFQLEEDGEEVALEHVLMIPSRYGATQFLEASLTLDLRVARMVLGDAWWAPVRVEFAHPAPRETRRQRTLFGCPVEFDADRYAIVFKRDDLDRPAINGNAHMFTYLEQHMEEAAASLPISVPQQVQKLIATNLADGNATLEHVARTLCMSPRTLQRHLAEANQAFASILAEVRKRAAEEYFRSTRNPNLAQLAHRLGYSDSTGASRYLRTCLHAGARTMRA
ncbi:AraC family transcriptional regulator ligand-binding domain-containing protein (plasmid) [Agrobacterium leguminum]|uniref:AraC family transcriptional regulator n=1 Tax=Agrobacterium leguminum TaxID=2792015 RepID=UPI0030D221FA